MKKLTAGRQVARDPDYSAATSSQSGGALVIVIHASVLIDPAKVDVAVSAAKEMMAESRKEPGCHAYTFTRDLIEPGRFHIIEEWENDEALAIHFEAPHMAKFQAVVPSLGLKEMKADRFVVSSKGPLRP
jgi:quinol monooxygenase YgiN